jgi:hypothetical protein
MTKYLTLPLLALGISLSAYSCEQAQSDATPVAEYICTTAQALQVSGLELNKPQTTALNSIINACAITAGGSNLTSASAVAAIFAGLVTLQQGGLLSGIKMKALAKADVALLQHRYALPQSTVDYIISHDFK